MSDPADAPWPALSYADWKDTCRTLHLWSQIVGKVRLAQTPWLNHGWHTALYVTPRGLTTGPVPHANGDFDMELDFVDGMLRTRTEGAAATVPLAPMPVADFFARTMAALESLKRPVTIHGAPNEMPEATPFREDHAPRVYDAGQARRFWRALVDIDRVLKRFRSGFLGKASPVHFFWGGFDLAVTRFSGRHAPPHPGGIPNLPDTITREAYSHEVSSVGFWPGGPGYEEAMFYSYTYPEPPGFRDAAVEPPQARFDTGLGEFLLPYEAVRTAADPDAALLAFCASTYAAAADAAGWDRADLECALGEPRRPRPVP